MNIQVGDKVRRKRLYSKSEYSETDWRIVYTARFVDYGADHLELVEHGGSWDLHRFELEEECSK